MASLTDDEREAIIARFFDYLKTFNYDKAKDLVQEKQKELNKSSNSQSVPQVWMMILNVLGMLAAAEKFYSSFLYLSGKWFGRKDAKGLYDTISQDCKRIDETSIQGNLSALAHICRQLVPYVKLKSDMIEFFSVLHEMTSVKFCDRSDLLMKVKSILRDSTDKFFHPMLEPLKSAFITECEVIEKLLEADISMSKWRFIDSLLYLQEAHSQISTLNSSTAYPSKDLWKNTFLGMKAPITPELYIWLRQYKEAIYSKFSLYFHDVLSNQVPQNEMKTYLNLCYVDYYSKLAAFYKKTDAYLISLVFNSIGLEVSGPGYTYNSSDPVRLDGKQAYISIFCYPDCRVPEDSMLSYIPEPHQTVLIMSMSSKEKQLNQSDKPIDVYDEKTNSVYFISKIDPTVSLVVIYKSRKTDREKKAVTSYLQELSSHLRYTKLFQDLRPS